jgi:hypothetical protein
LVLCGLLRFGFARHISTAFRRHSDRGGLRYLDAILMNTSLLRQVAQTFLAEYEEQENVDWSPEWRALAELARSALAAPANCCEIAVAIAIKYVLDNVKQVEAIGQRLSAGPFAGGWSTACDEIIERLCDPSAPTARPAPADSALREVATTFLAAYEEQEDADWSPEWRALAERAKHALSPVERGGEGRWFDPMSPKFDPGRVLVGLRPSKPVAPSPAAESDGRVGCAVCAMCGELLRAEYQLGPAQFGVGQRITPAEQMPVAWIGDAGLTLLEVQGRAMIFRSELKGSGNNERPLYFHPAPPAPEVSEAKYGAPWLGWLTTEEMTALRRFHETTADDESYDVPKPMMKRLAEIGAVQHVGFGRYYLTNFGDAIVNYEPAAQVRANDSGVGND